MIKDSKYNYHFTESKWCWDTCKWDYIEWSYESFFEII